MRSAISAAIAALRNSARFSCLAVCGLALLLSANCVVPPTDNGNAGNMNDNAMNENATNDNAMNDNASNDNGDEDANQNANGDVEPASARLVVFADPDSDFTTTEIYDVEGEVVEFNAADEAMIWTADDSSFDGWPVERELFFHEGFFQIRFGSENGEMKAYFTEAVNETICDIQNIGGRLQIFPSKVFVPQN